MKRDKNNLLKLIGKNAPAPVQFRFLMQSLGVTKGERPHFKEFVDELVDAGELVRLKGNAYALPKDLKVITGRLSAHRDGYGFVVPDEGGEDVFIPARYMRDNMHGDRVEARLEPEKRSGKREGRIVRTVERAYTKIVGRFEAAKNFGHVVPDEQRITHDIYIPAGAFGNARSGEVVVAEITSYPSRHRNAEGRIVEVLGLPDNPEVEVQTIIRKYDLPHEFSPAALKAARSVSQEVGEQETAGRKDLRRILTVTIDGETARDFDDAVSIEKDKNGLYRLRVSIADVSHYVKPGSPLDQDAYVRGTSVYFPDRCIPMLPEELSNGICSLNPHVERLALTAEMLFDKGGEMIESAFYPSVIKSDARLTYTIVKRIVVDADTELTLEYRQLVPDLMLMKELSLILTAKRRKRGSIDFDLPEPQIVLDLQGQTEAIIRAERNLAHKLIEEFMLAANEAVASHMERRGVPFLYRVHETPDPVKLNDFREFIFNFGYEFTMTGDRVNPGELQSLLEKAEGKPEEKMLNEVLLRCMKQARYAAENLGHFGLASPCYTHFTSPIRRYPDLVVHRILKGAIAKRLKQGDMERLEETLPEIAGHTSRRERVAMEAEREIVELKKLQFMRDKVGEEFDGFVTGVTSFGFFVELVELFVEGLVHITTLGNDFYRYVEKQHSLVGERTRETYRIGDKTRVRVAAVNLETRRIEFVLVSCHEACVQPASAQDGLEYPKIPVKGKMPAFMARGMGAASKKEGGGKGKGSGKRPKGGRGAGRKR